MGRGGGGARCVDAHHACRTDQVDAFLSVAEPCALKELAQRKEGTA